VACSTVTFTFTFILPGVKQPDREADHAPSHSAEAKNEWNYTSTFPYAFTEVKGDNFSFHIWNYKAKPADVTSETTAQSVLQRR
jgi:hypothetical protein